MEDTLHCTLAGNSTITSALFFGFALQVVLLFMPGCTDSHFCRSRPELAFFQPLEPLDVDLVEGYHEEDESEYILIIYVRNLENQQEITQQFELVSDSSNGLAVDTSHESLSDRDILITATEELINNFSIEPPGCGFHSAIRFELFVIDANNDMSVSIATDTVKAYAGCRSVVRTDIWDAWPIRCGWLGFHYDIFL